MNIQIFGLRKSFDTKKAERWFKERRSSTNTSIWLTRVSPPESTAASGPP